jgi:hypothetical protein
MIVEVGTLYAFVLCLLLITMMCGIMCLALSWFARALSSAAGAALNLKQVQAFEPAEGEPAPAPPAAAEPKLNTRNRLSDLSDAELAAAVMDSKVITADENNGIEADVEPIPRGGRGVYARTNGRQHR